MTLGLMQPYFFPYLGYFDLISRCDQWIVFDTAQYIRRGWVNRNRILHPTVSWQYITVPVNKHNRETPINEMETNPYGEWAPRILGQLQHYRKKAPGYAVTVQLVEECLSSRETNLARLNVITLRKTCETLGISFHAHVLSEMNLTLGPVAGPSDWALRISEALKADDYINPPGGYQLYDPRTFAASGIKLTIQEPFQFDYKCPGYKFEPGLSVIDALMWNSPESIRGYLNHLKSQSFTHESKAAGS
jgi:hypothetical protein